VWLTAQNKVMPTCIIPYKRSKNQQQKGYEGMLTDNVPTILLVEDVEEIRDAAEKLLTADGYRVVPARDEEDAVVRATHRPPNIMLVNLAGSSSRVIETARQIRERIALSPDLPVLIFGADTIPEGEELEMAGNIHLTRPDNFDQLRECVRRLLHRAPIPELD
jgi:DNA-binding response OmpR family regulator